MSEQQTQDAATTRDAVMEIDIDPDAIGNDAACADQPLAARIEALLVSTDRPLQDKRLAELLGIDGKGKAAVTAISEAVEQLNESYASTGRAFRIERVAKGWQVLTHADFGPLLMRLHADRQQARLSQAALETLSIIAYRQPIMRAEIEAIRGVACGEVLRGLMERRLVRVAGRAEELGRPMLYGTSSEFLNVFGLASIDDLPAVEGLKREPAYRPTRVTPEAGTGAEHTDDAGDATESAPDSSADQQDEPKDATSAPATTDE